MAEPLRIGIELDLIGLDKVTQGLDEVARKLEIVRGAQIPLKQSTIDISDVARIASGEISGLQYYLEKLAKGTELSAEEMKDFKQQVRMAGREAQAMIGVYRRTGVEVFWLGLGTMFLVMSYARMRRSAFGVERAQRSLRRADEELVEAQEELNTAMSYYGPGSRQVVEASRRLEDAQWNLEYAEEGARQAIEQQYYAWLMLILGTAPTLIRAIFSITSLWYQHIIAQTMVKAHVDATTASWMVQSGAIQIHIPLVGALTVSYWKLAIAVGLATAGITLLVGALASLAIQAQVEDQMKRMRREIESTSEVASEFPVRTGSPLEIKTKWGGWTEVPEILTGPTPRLEYPQVGASQVSIVNYGPWFIREEADIYKITKEQSRRSLRRIYSHTGRYT